MVTERIYEIIARKFTSNAETVELKELAKWLKEDKKNLKVFNSLQDYWYHNLANEDNAKDVFNRISYHIETEKGLTGQSTKVLSVSWHSRSWVKVAAVILVVLSFSLTLYLINNQVAAPEVAATLEKVNPPGQKSTFLLSDGTMVKLNSGSRLSFPEKFDGKNREVYLDGEAFFEVTHDESKPFIVRSGDISTTVLGTSFNVTAYADEDMLRVALITGKVKVENRRESILAEREINVDPGQMVIYRKRYSNVEVVDGIPEHVLAWRDNILIFSDVELMDMLKSLERWYGVNITIENAELLDRRFSGKFADRSLEYVLDVLSYNGEFEYRIEGKNVLVIAKSN